MVFARDAVVRSRPSFSLEDIPICFKKLKNGEKDNSLKACRESTLQVQFTIVCTAKKKLGICGRSARPRSLKENQLGVSPSWKILSSEIYHGR